MQTTALAIKAPWSTQLRKVDLAEPGPGWVRLRIRACGICGTDQTAAVEAADWSPVGHEIAAEIEALGPNVANLTVGQAVVVESSSYCGTCPTCRDGRVDLCIKAPNIWGQAAMGMSERMLCPAVACVPYDGLDPWEACLAEPVGVALDMVQVADIRLGQSVCVVGPGPIGLAAVALARHRGAARLVCLGTTRNPRRLDTARELGAETATWDGKAVPEALRRGFDHVLMTAPTGCIVPGLDLLGFGGTETFIGIGHGDSQISFNANDFHFRKLQLRASFAAPAIYFPAVLRLMRAGIVPAAKLVSHRFPLSQADRAFAACRDGKDATLKVVIEP
jgi:L-iditol 2-dehydrogenase